MTVLEHLALFVAHFLPWTLLIYWVHRLAHMVHIPIITAMHRDHHRFITRNGKSQWEWNNLLLFNDTWRSTADLWLTEVIPTIAFCAVTGYWWMLVFYYLWAAFIQEVVEHNPSFNMYPWITSGRWHLIHHSNSRANYGLFIPLWDRIFGTAVMFRDR